MTENEKAIFNELTQALENLGARSDLLCIVGSFKNTLPDEEVLAELRCWNKCKKNGIPWPSIKSLFLSTRKAGIV